MKSSFILTISLIALSLHDSVLAFAPHSQCSGKLRLANQFGNHPKSLTIYANSDEESEIDISADDVHINDIPTKQIPGSTAEDDKSILQRFLSPKIDDPGLPLTDVLLAQIVAPSFQTFWIFAAHAPSPSWLRPLGSYLGEAPELAPRGSLLAPTLIHGAGLAVCWLAGALAARFYEKESFILKDVSDPRDIWERVRSYDTVGE
jgi:hypothetical protein